MDVVDEVEELLLAVGLAGRVGGQETLRTLTASRLPDPLDTQPANTGGRTLDVLASNTSYYIAIILGANGVQTALLAVALLAAMIQSVFVWSIF